MIKPDNDVSLPRHAELVAEPATKPSPRRDSRAWIGRGFAVFLFAFLLCAVGLYVFVAVYAQ
jgi:hypothetical protein